MSSERWSLVFVGEYLDRLKIALFCIVYFIIFLFMLRLLLFPLESSYVPTA